MDVFFQLGFCFRAFESASGLMAVRNVWVAVSGHKQTGVNQGDSASGGGYLWEPRWDSGSLLHNSLAEKSAVCPFVILGLFASLP